MAVSRPDEPQIIKHPTCIWRVLMLSRDIEMRTQDPSPVGSE